MDTILKDMSGDIITYLDDLIISSPDIASHLPKLDRVLQRLQDVGLKIKWSKCKFLKEQTTFLGHKLNSKGIHTLYSKIDAITEFSRPTSVKNVRSFL